MDILVETVSLVVDVSTVMAGITVVFVLREIKRKEKEGRIKLPP